MAIKAYNPTTPARRGMTSQDMSEITTSKPQKRLIKSKKQQAGRNNTGRITVRHRGGGIKRHYRLLNHRLKAGVSAVIKAIEYDPNRSARIALIEDQAGESHYILAELGMAKGQTIKVGSDAPVSNGNRLPLIDIPVGAQIYAIELQPGKGAQIVRAAGAKAQLMAKEGDYVQVKLPSGEVRKFRKESMASLGTVGNVQHQNIKIGSAGRKRLKGIRPTVRGVVQNACDHPHGGGDGGRHGTGKAPRTPWGQLTLGYRTRRKKTSNKMIIRSRHMAKRSK